ncbi:MAG: carbon-nitrogen hydrolase family protein, partial [Bacteroidia bacterium]|nr:carbon-nitrogen hydrolase family protein [Bacteroidia bacterium]
MSSIAIVQSGPVYNDIARSLEKAEALISDASKSGADLIAFGECWLCGYPAWLDYSPNVAVWDSEPVKAVWAKMYENALEVPGEALERIQKIAKDKSIHIIIGANEVVKIGPGNGSLYNVVLFVDNDGHLRNHHRKLMPTYTEKLVHGLGDGKGLRVVDTNIGRIGSLICWEHWMPLARQAMHDEAEDIHFALWPYVKEMHQIA